MIHLLAETVTWPQVVDNAVTGLIFVVAIIAVFYFTTKD